MCIINNITYVYSCFCYCIESVLLLRWELDRLVVIRKVSNKVNKFKKKNENSTKIESVTQTKSS